VEVSQSLYRPDLLSHYERAKAWMEDSVFASELTWQASLELGELSEQDFLREYAWVVLNSGFRESVVRRKFGYISLCFFEWESAREIALNAAVCKASAVSAFRNLPKLDAIVNGATRVSEIGFRRFREEIQNSPHDTLRSLPFIGAVTYWHLAKNLGVDVAKPDRHLKRVAQRFGYSDVRNMCSEVREHFGDKVSIIDLVIWRYEEQHQRGYSIEQH
jgi:hypothetical protein